jgi:hypothetical protein
MGRDGRPGTPRVNGKRQEKPATEQKLFIQVALVVGSPAANNTLSGNEQLGRSKATCFGLRPRARRGRRESRSCLISPASHFSRRGVPFPAWGAEGLPRELSTLSAQNTPSGQATTARQPEGRYHFLRQLAADGGRGSDSPTREDAGRREPPGPCGVGLPPSPSPRVPLRFPRRGLSIIGVLARVLHDVRHASG